MRSRQEAPEAAQDGATGKRPRSAGDRLGDGLIAFLFLWPFAISGVGLIFDVSYDAGTYLIAPYIIAVAVAFVAMAVSSFRKDTSALGLAGFLFFVGLAGYALFELVRSFG